MRQDLDQILAQPMRTYDQACKDTGYNPTMYNCCREWRKPDPHTYAAFEIRPCYSEDGYTTSCEHEPWLAQFWTVYGARDAEWTEWEAITDVSTKKLAWQILIKLYFSRPYLWPKKAPPMVYESTVGGNPDLYEMWRNAVERNPDTRPDHKFHKIPPYEGPTDWKVEDDNGE